MPQLTAKNILIIGVVGVVILGGILLYVSGWLPQTSQQQKQPQQKEGTVSAGVFSIAGSIVSVDAKSDSFVLLQPKEERQFTVKVGKNGNIVRLVFPFDLANPPAGATFSPERKPATLGDLKKNDQVFVRSSHAIETGKDILNPLEIQILP